MRNKIKNKTLVEALFTDEYKRELKVVNPKLIKYGYTIAKLLESTAPEDVQEVVTKFLVANSRGLVGFLAKTFSNDKYNYETKVIACRRVCSLKLSRELERTEPLYDTFIEAMKAFEVAVDFDSVTDEEIAFDAAAFEYDEESAGMDILTEVCTVLNGVKTSYDSNGG